MFLKLYSFSEVYPVPTINHVSKGKVDLTCLGPQSGSAPHNYPSKSKLQVTKYLKLYNTFRISWTCKHASSVFQKLQQLNTVIIDAQRYGCLFRIRIRVSNVSAKLEQVF